VRLFLVRIRYFKFFMEKTKSGICVRPLLFKLSFVALRFVMPYILYFELVFLFWDLVELVETIDYNIIHDSYNFFMCVDNSR